MNYKSKPKYPKLADTGKLISTGIISLGLLFSSNAQNDSLKVGVPDTMYKNYPNPFMPTSKIKAKLNTNYPNPFMPTSTIKVDLFYGTVNDSAVVNLLDSNKNIISQKVIHIEDPGKIYYAVNFDDIISKDLKSGTYFYELRYKGEVHTEKYLIIK